MEKFVGMDVSGVQFFDKNWQEVELLKALAAEMREAYGLAPDTQIWMTPSDLMEWKRTRKYP